ncbi:hypothetical protein C8J57DRAFT_1241040 [Mycena rebaudengoi]|nr:hypothetical protein C8J57DRAFT_1241040 [Mycena rebaudengoi]
MYPDLFSFKPERFLLNRILNPDVRTSTFAFGFGRRIRPGGHMAMSSLWFSIASILAAFDISKAVGEDGKVVEPSYEYEPVIVSYNIVEWTIAYGWTLESRLAQEPKNFEIVTILSMTEKSATLEVAEFVRDLLPDEGGLSITRQRFTS